VDSFIFSTSPNVVFNQAQNLSALLVREAQPPHNFMCNLHANFNVTVEADAIWWFVRKRRWLADVVQQRAPGQRR